MKPRIVFLPGDTRMGGVMANMQSLVNSRLSDRFDLSISARSDAGYVSNLDPKPDILIFNLGCAWRELPNLWRLGRLREVKLAIRESNYCERFEALNVPSIPRFRLMLRLSYGCADRVIAVSHGQADWMRTHRLVSAAKLIEIASCPNIEPMFSVPTKPVSSPLVLGAYGRFAPQKGFEVLVQAMQHLSGDRFQLLLGGSGELEDDLKRLAAGANHIHFLGRITDVPEFLAQCDVVVIPSRWEPSGNVLVESKAAGKPTLVTDVDGLPEQIDNCGLVVPPDNPTLMAEAIASLPDRNLSVWGQRARNLVTSAWETHLTRWECLLSDLMSTR
ncbi:MAG: glycosyltransferase family 4 protein [Cyanobacteria bacterium J06639_1]